MERHCSVCGSKLTQYNPGKLCFACQEKMREAMANGDKPYYDVDDMMEILGLGSQEQVRRKGRSGLIPGKIPGIKAHRYNKEVVNEWIGSSGVIKHKPASPIQEEAYKRCINEDHGWLRDEQFDGIAYRTELISEPGEYSISVSYKRTCYFCGHTEIVSL